MLDACLIVFLEETVITKSLCLEKTPVLLEYSLRIQNVMTLH